MDVAVKVLRPDLDPSSQGVQRLRDEGRLLGRLTHPTILRVYDLVVIEGRAALITEFVDGDDLARVIRGTDKPPPRAVFEIIAQVAAALDAAWSWPSVTDGQPLHLVHRDIKPDNIRLDPHGVVKLLDFGIAQASTIEREAETSVNIIMGSAQYLAPERMVQQEVGPESDVFALGCTLYEALAGEALFHRKSMRQMYLLMIEEQRLLDFVRERVAALPEGRLSERARSLLMAMLAYDKLDRPTAGDVASRCDMISDSIGGTTLRRWARNHLWPTPAHEEGPLEGRSFTTAQPLPAPEARTLHLRAPDSDKPPPDLSETDTDPGSRVPVLGELDAADAPDVPDEGPSPWSNAELVALDQSSPSAPVPSDDDEGSRETAEISEPLPELVETTGNHAPAPEVADPPPDDDDEVTLDDPATDERVQTDEAAQTDESAQTLPAGGGPPLTTGGEELPEVPEATTDPPRQPSTDTPSEVPTLPPGPGVADGPLERLAPRSLEDSTIGQLVASTVDDFDDDAPTIKMKIQPRDQNATVSEEVVKRALKSLEDTDVHTQVSKIPGPPEAPSPLDDPSLAEAFAETPPGVPRTLSDDEPELPDIGHDTGDEGVELQQAAADGSDDELPRELTFEEPEVVEQASVGTSGGLHVNDGVIDLQGTPPIQPYRTDGPPSVPDPAEVGETGDVEGSASEGDGSDPHDLGGPELTDDYVPQPGDVDLSDVLGGQGSGDVQLVVAPPGKEVVADKPKRRRRSNQPGRASVMLFSGLMGILVGAAIFSVPALLIWLFAG